jgi:hypothetical protein
LKTTPNRVYSNKDIEPWERKAGREGTRTALKPSNLRNIGSLERSGFYEKNKMNTDY